MSICRYEKCTKRASFGEVMRMPMYCKTHKTVTMFDVRHDECQVPTCRQRATFGWNGTKKATHCVSHKSVGMNDVRHPSCRLCHRRPSYAKKCSSSATHCHLHKTGDMRNVKHKLCESCDTYATYGFVKNRPTHCLQHKQENMRNVKATVCRECSTLKPRFGNHLVGRQYCKSHHNPSQHWEVSTCRELLCKNIATHSLKGKLPFTYCESHSPTEFTSYFEQPCVSCGLPCLCDTSGLCLLACSRRSAHHGKYSEHALHQLFVQNNLVFTYDQQPGTGCTKKRPDFVFTTLFGVVIVENDEHQHRDYPAECELARMQELHLAFGESTHFVRFNPDYSETQTDALDDRHKTLLAKLMLILEQPDHFFSTHFGLTVQYMYYD
jgi:hypothetical protein